MTAPSQPADRMRGVLLIVAILSLVQVACKVLSAEMPAVDLPDLAISTMSLQMQGQSNGGCVDAYGPYEVEVVIANQGLAPANGIVVERIPGDQASIDSLAPGARSRVRFPATAAEGVYTFQIDPQNLIAETDEQNNRGSFLAPTPTPPPVCTPDQSQKNPLETPAPTRSLSGLVYHNLGQLWTIGAGGQPLKLLDGFNARISPDGRQAIYEAEGDLWLADLAGKTTRNLTNTPDLIEGNAQWWPANPTKVVFAKWFPTDIRANSAGELSMINVDGSGYESVGGGPSMSPPSLRSDGKSIAYDILGNPMIYEIGTGSHPFPALSFGLNPEYRVEFISPAWSPNGQSLLWWVVQLGQAYTLMVFDLDTNMFSPLHAAQPLAGTQGLYPNPRWSPDGQWLAYQTRGETSPNDLTIVRADGSQEYRLGLATDPLWSPDGQDLYYLQWPPRANSEMEAKFMVIDVPSWETSPVELPAGSLMTGWMKPLP